MARSLNKSLVRCSARIKTIRLKQVYQEKRERLKLHHRKWHWKRCGVLFVHVPKAAGTSISTPLYGRFLGHYTAQQIDEFDASLLRGLPSFGIVRNPWDRCVSAYRFARRPELDNGCSPSIDASVREEVGSLDSFETFIHEWLATKDVNNMDYVFQEQSFFLMNNQDQKMVDYIGHLETMDEVQKWLNRHLAKPISLKKLNVSGESTDYRQWYDDDSRKLVSSIYDRDITNFGYEF